MKKILSNVILVIAIGVFLFSGYKLYGILAEYNKGDSEYEAIQEIVIKQNVPAVTEEDLQVEEPSFVVDFDKLREMNKDVVAWIRFDEPSQISYPVVRCLDNKKYLNTTFEGRKNSAGALFVDYRNTGDFTEQREMGTEVGKERPREAGIYRQTGLEKWDQGHIDMSLCLHFLFF